MIRSAALWALALGALLTAATGARAFDGRVVDGADGKPIAGAVVTLGPAQTRTDPGGRFHVAGTVGQVMARAPGYRAARAPADLLARDGGLVKLARFRPHALYLTVYGIGSTKLREGALALARKGRINALVIDLKGDRGLVPYPSPTAAATAPASRSLTTIRDLPELAARLHRAGLYLIARIVVFKDEPLASAHPQLAIRRADGGLFRDREGLSWTDPFQPAVRDYNIGLAVEAARAGFDEIQFDYLRFPDSSARLKLARPSNQATRTAAIADFLAEARQRLSPYNVFLAADIFGYVCWNRDDTGIGQQLETIVPNVDYLSPMLYPSGFQFGIPGVRNPVTNVYAVVRQSLAEAQRRLNVPPIRFRPWLQAFRDYAFDRRLFDADEVAAQVRAATDFGSDGWMLWNARNTYSDAGLSAASPPASSAACS